MNAQRGVNLTSSIGEFSGYYNIWLPDWYDDGNPVLCSVDQLPDFEFPESWEVYLAAMEWFAKAVPCPRRASEFVPVFEEIFCLVDETDDRTQSVENIDYSRLDLPLLRRIQREFLGRYPLWRVFLVGEDASTSIVVYPTVIRFGDRPGDVDPDEALRELVPHGMALRDAYLRPKRAHLAALKRLLPDAVKSIGDQPFLVCGVLDNHEGDYSRLTVFVLIQDKDECGFDLDGPPGAPEDLLWSCSGYGVDSSGAIVGGISYVDDCKATPFCVTPYMPPADYRGPLFIIERESGVRHAYELKSENIIRTIPER